MARVTKSTKQLSLNSSLVARATKLEPIVHLWALRLLVPLKQSKHFIEDFGYGDDDIAEELGLEPLDSELSNWCKKKLLSH